MIEIAIVTSSTWARKPRRAGDTALLVTAKGSIWIRRGEKVRRRCLECLTAAGVRLELEAFFERYKDRSFRLQIVQPKAFDPTIAPAIVSLVPAPVFDASHSYKQFTGKRDLAGGSWRFTPFDYGFTPRTHTNFQPFWHVPPEPMTLLKSSAGDGFTYPSTDDDEEDETK